MPIGYSIEIPNPLGGLNDGLIIKTFLDVPSVIEKAPTLR
jgi:hypothetical protein